MALSKDAQDFLEFSFSSDIQSLNATMSKLKNDNHHFSVVLPEVASDEIKVTLDGLEELINSCLLHRLFWTELCQRDDFQIFRRNAFRTDDLFVSHPIIGFEFEHADPENATQLGGVFVFDNQKWLVGSEILTAHQAAHELGSYEESLTAIAENSDFEYLGQALIALTFTMPNLSMEYGFELTDAAADWMIDTALEYAEPDSFEVAADLNPLFREFMSWKMLPPSNQEKILNFLLLGSDSPKLKVRNDAHHFLACMALHADTPEKILAQLSTLKDKTISRVIKSRSKCSRCLKVIGYGLCNNCSPISMDSELLISEDEADEIYLRGLEQARNGDKFDAIETWAQLARSGDVTSIDGIIVTLWRLGMREDAKSWIYALSRIDLEQFNELAERLEVSIAEFEKYASGS